MGVSVATSEAAGNGTMEAVVERGVAIREEVVTFLCDVGVERQQPAASLP